MHTDNLVRMANQIGKFFAVQGEERAVAGIADHIKKFWEPRMKAGIYELMDAGGSGLDPLALKALEKLRKDTAAGAAAPAPKNGKSARGKAAAE